MKYLILCFLLLGCCGVPDPPSWHQDFRLLNLTPEQETSAQNALEQWQQASRGEITSRITEHGSWVISQVSTIPNGQDILGQTDSYHSTIIIMDDLKAPLFDLVILHEMGHAFGLDHSPNIPDVMYKNATDKPAILTQHDQDSLRALVGE